MLLLFQINLSEIREKSEPRNRACRFRAGDRGRRPVFADGLRPTPHQSPPATASPHRGSLGRFGETAKKLIRSTNLQLQFSIFFCFSKRKRWRVRNGHGGTSCRKRRLLSSVLISSFPNRKLNSRFGGDFDFPPDLLEPTKKTSSVFLDLSRDS